MPLTPVLFNGMQSLEIDELVGLNQALVAENLYLDKEDIEPRNGYRALTAAALAGAGTTQGAWRFRPSPSSARTVYGIGGGIYTVTDPASQTTLGTNALAGTPFGGSANLSAAQLGRYLYLATDETGVAWNRMDSAFALVGLGSLPQGAVPTVNLGSISLVKFTSLAAPTLVSTTQALFATDYHSLQPTGTPNSAVYNFGADQNWSGFNWLFVVISPVTQSDGGGTISISIASSGGTFEKIGEVFDTPGHGSPSCVYLPLDGLTAATRAAARKIQFTNDSNLKFYIVHGYMAVPSAPSDSPAKYAVSFRNSTSGQESPLSEQVTVVYSSNAIVIPQFHSVYRDGGSYTDEGNRSANPDTLDRVRLFNKGGGTAYPNSYEFAAVPTLSGAIPVNDRFPNADTVRLWRTTATGIRLVKTQTLTGGEVTWSIVDDQGDGTLTHDLFRPGGTPPRATALAARAQRLIGAYENRIYISSYIATSMSSDPYPQFPDIPVDDSDGWSFDIAPSNVEQVQYLCNGDALYIVSNEACYVMTQLEPNSPPFKIFERGAMGRRACCWAENRLFVASHDGVYSFANRAQPEELTQNIRRMYLDWLGPDSTTQVCYQARKLYIFRGVKFLRYDFVKQRWTRGYVNNTMLHPVMWRDPGSSVQNLWFLASDRNVYRWQPGYAVGDANAATDDAGTAIPAWIYETGFEFTPVKTRVLSIFADITTGPVALSVHTSMEDIDGRVKEFRKIEHQETCWADYSAYKFRIKMVGMGGAVVRRLLWERESQPGTGA